MSLHTDVSRILLCQRIYKNLITFVHLFIVWMARRNARVVLEVVLGRDEKNREQGETLTLERKDPRISVGASCRGYESV